MGLSQDQQDKLDTLQQKNDDLERLLQDLQNQIQKLEKSTNAKFQQQDNQIKDLQTQASSMQKSVDDIQKQIEDILKQIKDLSGQMKEFKSQLKILENMVKSSEGKGSSSGKGQTANTNVNIDLYELVGKVKEIRNDLDENIDHLKSNDRKLQEQQRILDYLQEQIKSGNFGQAGAGITEEMLNQKLKQLRDELMKLIDALRDELAKKCSYEDLYKSESLILEKVDNIAGALMKKFIDKNDAINSLNYLENRINQIVITLNGQDKHNEADGLLVKRQLLWSCASCDKNLDQYSGKLGNYRNWARFPAKETSPERLGKFVQGYKSQIEKFRAKEDNYKSENKSHQLQSSGEFPKIQKSSNDGTQPYV